MVCRSRQGECPKWTCRRRLKREPNAGLKRQVGRAKAWAWIRSHHPWLIDSMTKTDPTACLSQACFALWGWVSAQSCMFVAMSCGLPCSWSKPRLPHPPHRYHGRLQACQRDFWQHSLEEGRLQGGHHYLSTLQRQASRLIKLDVC